MRVVDQHGELLALVDGLEATGDAGGACKSAGCLGCAHPESVRGGDRGKCVGDIEMSGKRDPHFDLPTRGVEVKRGAGGVETHVGGAEVCLGALG